MYESLGIKPVVDWHEFATRLRLNDDLNIYQKIKAAGAMLTKTPVGSRLVQNHGTSTNYPICPSARNDL